MLTMHVTVPHDVKEFYDDDDDDDDDNGDNDDDNGDNTDWSTSAIARYITNYALIFL